LIKSNIMDPAFKRLNTWSGWIAFGIAAFTYLRTQEASGSWWDCGEFMAAAYKLQVVHEPGSPLFLMVGKIFSFLATNPAKVPIFINAVSSLSSAATILFLFWSITHFARRLLMGRYQGLGKSGRFLVLACGFIGSLSYTFSDTFWFSAVESEVYALSSLFTAFVFWAVLKWEEEMEIKPERADRWLILIAFSMGLSIGVHLLNLLTIPALVFVYYFKKFPVNAKGIFLTSLVSLFLLAFVLFGLIPYSLKIATWADIFGVNTLGLPFNTGALWGILFLFSLLGFGIYGCYKRKYPQVQKIVLAVFFILLGYSSYFMVILRAEANPPLNNSNPDNVNALYGYLGREQYEESPVIWGPDYNSEIKTVEKGPMEYRKGSQKYEEKGNKLDYVYQDGQTHIFPRLWSREKSSDYASWLGYPDTKKSPEFLDNISFFITYQFDYMYLRYFLWNFVGRQNDTPSSFPNPVRGNWLSGIHFLDAIRLGNQSTLPSSLSQNKAYNKLYFLPLFLGLVGMVFQLRKTKTDFTVIALLFFFTGIALALYLNMPPNQPRERDYAFAGSFYAFSFWIGLGLIPLFDILNHKIKAPWALCIAFFFTFLAVPVLMGFQEWDDHDRSNRTVVKDFAANYLNSCAPNAILFTNGDNETYPLWYAQEVEGIRTDIRVINLNLFDADWCIDKAKLKVNDSDPLPISWDHELYKDGVRDVLNIKQTAGPKFLEIDKLLDFASSKDSSYRDEYGDNYFPGTHLKLTIHPDEVIGNGALSIHEKDKIVSTMEWTLNKGSITKGQLIILDILNQNHWKRPIYFCSTSGEEAYLGLSSYLWEEGITLRVLPMKRDSNATSLLYPAHLPQMYTNVMKKFHWGNIKGNIHMDDQTNSFADSFKDVFMDLATSLSEQHQFDSCRKVLDKESEVLPEHLPPLGNNLGEQDFRILKKAHLYLLCQSPENAISLLKREINRIKEEVRFIHSQGSSQLAYYTQTLSTAKALYQAINKMTREEKIQNRIGYLDFDQE